VSFEKAIQGFFFFLPYFKCVFSFFEKQFLPTFTARHSFSVNKNKKE